MVNLNIYKHYLFFSLKRGVTLRINIGMPCSPTVTYSGKNLLLLEYLYNLLFAGNGTLARNSVSNAFVSHLSFKDCSKTNSFCLEWILFRKALEYMKANWQ